jgi:uncharacterized protein DUF4864
MRPVSLWQFPVWAMLALGLVLLAAPAPAVEEADSAAIQGLIKRQIEAFRSDDAATAYAAAAPTIQRMFPLDRFMAMVREGYKPVYRQRSYDFGQLRETAAGFFQAVRIQDEEGIDWLAVYALERQPDGSWRIAGCTLLKQPGDPV